MTVPPVAHATTAAPLAALLPARQGKAWKVDPAPYGIRNIATASRITDGRRALIVVEEGNRVELFADRPDDFAITPDAVAASTDPASVAALAARALRWILPGLDAGLMRTATEDAANSADGLEECRRVLHHKGTVLTEFGFHLIDQGAHPMPREGGNGPVLEWTAASGAEWAVSSHGVGANFSLVYEGPLSGLYGALPVLLPPLDTHTASGASSAFARHLVSRFPQLQPADDDMVEFGGHHDIGGWIALPERAELGAPVSDATRVCAEFGLVGIDFLLAVTTHLL
ncbi:hypothetical protein [Streptomyces sp. NPDC046976]|uniref:hypothetical protein n=1 Tax=Streptomyces sp. NPDC046976 TaxID=3155258 RepID=UPI0033DE5F28